MSMTDYDIVNGMNLNDPDLAAWGGENEMLELGTYIFEIEKAAVAPSKKAGNPTLVVSFRVVSEGTQKGKMIRGYYSLMPDQRASRMRLKNLLLAIGLPLNAEGFSINAMVGLQCFGEIIPNEYIADDQRTGLQTKRTNVKLCNERPLQPAAVAQPNTAAVAMTRQPPPANTAPKNAPIARRAPTPATVVVATQPGQVPNQ